MQSRTSNHEKSFPILLITNILLSTPIMLDPNNQILSSINNKHDYISLIQNKINEITTSPLIATNSKNCNSIANRQNTYNSSGKHSWNFHHNSMFLH